MTSTRERVLETLLSHPRSTIEDLAAAVDINAISVRHHLSSLQAEGLLSSEEERHGVGRPRLVYYLTDKGLEKFPSRYLRLANRLLDQIKNNYPENSVNEMFTKMANELANDHAEEARELSFEGKLELIKRLLTDEGFSMNWEKRGDQIQIHEVTCPYYQVSQSHPEICAVDQTLISRILNIPVEKIHCVLRGDNRCTYIVSNIPAEGSENV